MKIEEIYKYVIRVFGIWAGFFFFLEILTGKNPPVGLIEVIATPLVIYLARTLKLRGGLSAVDQALCFGPAMFLLRHIFFQAYGAQAALPQYLFYVFLSGVGAYLGYQYLDRLKPK